MYNVVFYMMFFIQHVALTYNIIKERGQERIRTSEVERQRIYSPPHLATLEPALLEVDG
jgi:hypothetical protein